MWVLNKTYLNVYTIFFSYCTNPYGFYSVCVFGQVSLKLPNCHRCIKNKISFEKSATIFDTDDILWLLSSNDNLYNLHYPGENAFLSCVYQTLVWRICTRKSLVNLLENLVGHIHRSTITMANFISIKLMKKQR